MKNLLSVFLLAFLLVLSACASNEPAESKNQSSTEDKKDKKDTNDNKDNSNGKDIYFKDGEAKIKDVKVKITETKVIPVGEKGNEYGDKPVFAIWYEATNLADKDIDPTTAWLAIFTAIQDNDPNAINELEVGSLPDESHLDTQLETIKKDGTVANSVAYELDDSETPVTLVANQGLMGEEIGREDYEIK